MGQKENFLLKNKFLDDFDKYYTSEYGIKQKYWKQSFLYFQCFVRKYKIRCATCRYIKPTNNTIYSMNYKHKIVAFEIILPRCRESLDILEKFSDLMISYKGIPNLGKTINDFEFNHIRKYIILIC